MSNGYGDYWTTRAAEMAAHDASPPPLRFALQNAVGPWSAQRMLAAWHNGAPVALLTRIIQRGDQSDTLKTYGPTHPEAAHE